MWDEKMDEKRYNSQKYVDCYCTKHAEVLVGMKMFNVLNIFCSGVALFFFTIILIGHAELWIKVVVLVPFAGICILLPRWYYINAQKIMIKAGHSDSCSKKIGFLAALYAGGYSNFTIMKAKVDKNHPVKGR